MKELSIEEKAKAYDEVVNKLKGFMTQGVDPLITRADAQDFFPELKESEDEKIRRWIINEIKIKHHNLDEDNVDFVDKAIAWLEKQCEQKPADKVEQKFKVGDWVIDKQGIVHQIANVIEIVTCHTYGYDIVGGGYFNDNTEGVRLWTVQDAKDGDVLFTSSTASHETFIFKNIDEKGNAKCYFAYDSEDGFREGKYHFIGRATNRKPATKEQRDLLFQKMKEAGYEWDAEKKELKKVEQKSWSEEDEKMLNHIIGLLEGLPNLHNWLKSLKERCNWKPSDEQMDALHYVTNFDYGGHKATLVSLYEQLKKLKA